MGILSFLFGTAAKPSMDDQIRALLEKAAPGTFEIVSTRWDFNYAHADFQHHFVLVAAKADPDQQFQLRWHKPSPDGRVTIAEVQAAAQRARENSTAARTYVSALHRAGFTNAMAGVDGATVDVLLFQELEPKAARKVLSDLLATLRSVPGFADREYTIAFLETDALAKRQRDVLPSPAVQKAGGWRDDYTVFTWQFQPAGLAVGGPLESQYEIFLRGRRLSRYLDTAHREALKALAGRLRKTAFVDAMRDVQYSVAEAPPRAVWFSFPYWQGGPPNREAAAGLIEPEGYVVCLYEVDTGRTSQIDLASEAK